MSCRAAAELPLTAHGASRLAPSAHDGDDDHQLDATVSCDACDAVCCRLTVVLAADDRVPDAMMERDPRGFDVMKRADDGWCVAVDRGAMQCSIYAIRPTICRKFAAGSAYCRDERSSYADSKRRIPLTLLAARR
jgi:Fe-S-cluster containining protein